MNTRPNFIFIIADDHRARSLGAAGCGDVSTPVLDALAARGARFTQAHCQGGFDEAVCVPSRATLMTGQSVFALQRAQEAMESRPCAFTDPTATIPPALPTFPELLRRAGYDTHGIGKWHNDRASFARSFSSGDSIFFGGMCDHDAVPLHGYDPEGIFPPDAATVSTDLSTDIFRSAAQRFLESRDGANPFLLYAAFTAPHDPRTPPASFRPDPARIALPANYLPSHPFDTGDAALRDELLEDFPRSEAAIREHLADYYGMIAHLDDAIGQLLATAEARGLLENTIVVYTADHGLGIGSHGLMGKQNMYQHSLEVPLIMAGPGIAGGTCPDPLVWHGDTHATVLDCAGVAREAGDGASLRAWLAGGEGTRAGSIGAIYKSSQRMIRDERYKLIRYHAGNGPSPSRAKSSSTPGSEVEQLFDLASDPDEMANLAYSPAMQKVRERLSSLMQTWLAERGSG